MEPTAFEKLQNLPEIARQQIDEVQGWMRDWSALHREYAFMISEPRSSREEIKLVLDDLDAAARVFGTAATTFDTIAEDLGTLFEELSDLAEERGLWQPHSACQNCAWRGSDTELKEIRDILQRVSPGEPMPSGECPECGALCQPVKALCQPVKTVKA